MTTTDAILAEQAWTNALNQARNTTNALFNSYGLTKLNPTMGTYTTGSAGSAFDPNNIIRRDTNTGLITTDTSALNNLIGGQFGTAFGSNLMSQAMMKGASGEAAAVSALRGRGITGGGLRKQATSAAESEQTLGQAGVVSDLLSKLSGTYSGVVSDYGSMIGGLINTAAASGQEQGGASAAATTNTPITPVKEASGHKKGDTRVSGGWKQVWNGTKWVSTRKV